MILTFWQIQFEMIVAHEALFAQVAGWKPGTVLHALLNAFFCLFLSFFFFKKQKLFNPILSVLHSEWHQVVLHFLWGEWMVAYLKDVVERSCLFVEGSGGGVRPRICMRVIHWSISLQLLPIWKINKFIYICAPILSSSIWSQENICQH